jgi:hypothetical protein
MTELDKAAVKAGMKNAKKYNKQKRRHASRNSHVAAARFALAAGGFAWVLLSGVLDAHENHGDPAAALIPAIVAFVLVWFLLGFAERSISAAIAKHTEETRRAELEAAREAKRRAQEEADEQA